MKQVPPFSQRRLAVSLSIGFLSSKRPYGSNWSMVKPLGGTICISSSMDSIEVLAIPPDRRTDNGAFSWCSHIREGVTREEDEGDSDSGKWERI